MKFENKTFEQCFMFLFEFILTFFDGAIIILLINSNFKGTDIPITFFDGNYSDFTEEWFEHVAPIFILSLTIKMAI